SLAALFTLLCCGAPASAKPPTLDWLYPAGGQRAQTVEVTASGSFGRWPAQVWVDGPGVEVRPLAEKGKLSVSIASDAVPGLRWVRVYDEEGASTLRPFEVG